MGANIVKADKVLIIGLDGATFDVINVHKDELPVLKRCMDVGTRYRN